MNWVAKHPAIMAPYKGALVLEVAPLPQVQQVSPRALVRENSNLRWFFLIIPLMIAFSFLMEFLDHTSFHSPLDEMVGEPASRIHCALAR